MCISKVKNNNTLYLHICKQASFQDKNKVKPTILRKYSEIVHQITCNNSGIFVEFLDYLFYFGCI